MSSTVPPFWSNGPSPGQFYDFPNTHSKSEDKPFKHTQNPTTTSTSLVALTYKNGVIIAGDLLTSYGSLARFRNCPRVIKVNDNIILGAAGDYADFQYVKNFVEQRIINEDCLDDGIKLKPKSLYCWLIRIMYQRRSKFDPLFNSFVIGGIQDGEPFLSTIDKLGTAYTDKVICTGYGAHIALPLIRVGLEKNPDMGREEAIELVRKCMLVLYYRDARSFPKYQMAVMDKDEGCKIEGPLAVEDNWQIANLVKGY